MVLLSHLNNWPPAITEAAGSILTPAAISFAKQATEAIYNNLYMEPSAWGAGKSGPGINAFPISGPWKSAYNGPIMYDPVVDGAIIHELDGYKVVAAIQPHPKSSNVEIWLPNKDFPHYFLRIWLSATNFVSDGYSVPSDWHIVKARTGQYDRKKLYDVILHELTHGLDKAMHKSGSINSDESIIPTSDKQHREIRRFAKGEIDYEDLSTEVTANIHSKAVAKFDDLWEPGMTLEDLAQAVRNSKPSGPQERRIYADKNSLRRFYRAIMAYAAHYLSND